MTTPERPPFVAHWSEIEQPDDRRYDGDDELMSIGAAFGSAFGLTRLGIHHERLPPGRRTSFPHAESAEEEFVYVIAGEPDVWLDGHLHRLKPGDAVGFPAGTGTAHSFLNNTEAEVRLLVVGERKQAREPDRLSAPSRAPAAARRLVGRSSAARSWSSRRGTGPAARREGPARRRLGSPRLGKPAFPRVADVRFLPPE